MSEVRVLVRRLDPQRDADLPLPARMSALAAGADLSAALSEPLTLQPGARAAVPTGLQVAIPPGYEGQVRPRSGLAMKHGVTVLNAPGTIDADYRGEVRVLLVNLGQEPVTLRRGDRIAQLVVAPVVAAVFVAADDLDATARGSGGFGSTGSAGLESTQSDAVPSARAHTAQSPGACGGDT
ncbi:MAG: dUTP diphosphatase [Myxococcales bacterium]|nr:dUTP diphosphatase [Myxococcales bacterium]